MGRRSRHQNRRRKDAVPTKLSLSSDSGDAMTPNVSAVRVDANPDAGASCEMSEETYFRERTTLIDMEQKSADQHDKAILTLTAGALGLSITFLDKIAANPLPETLFLVGLSWLLFILAIICIVASFLTSQSACRRQRELLDGEYSTGLVPDENNRPADWTRYLNIGAYGLFVLGVICLALFSWWNLSAGDK